MKSLLYPSLLALSLLTACHPFEHLDPRRPGNSDGTPKPDAKTCQLTELTWGGTIQRFQFRYDTLGRITGYTATGATPRFTYEAGYVYDANGFVVKEQFVHTFLNDFNATNTFQYDAKGKLIPNPSLNKTLERNAAGQVVKLTKRFNANAIAYVIKYTYNLLGRKIRQEVTYTSGRWLVWKWDALGENIVRTESGNTPGVLRSSQDYTYDRKPNPLKTLYNFKGWEHTDYLDLKGWHPFDTVEDFGGNYGGSYTPIPLTNQNNPLKIVNTWVSEDGTTTSTTTTYAYEYNASGYPTSASTRGFKYQNCH